MNTIEVKAIADSFSNANRVIAEHQKDGHVAEAKGNLKSDGTLQMRSVHVTALGERLTDLQKKELKTAIRIVNAGYAFQTAFGIKLAHLGQYAAHVASLEAVLATNPAPAAGDRAPVTEDASEPVAGAHRGKAKVTA